MPRQPLSRERICDALESCRPGSGDLYTPDFAEVADHVAADPQWEEHYEQIQSIDLKISAAFLDVEIPASLEPRLMASLDDAARFWECEAPAEPKEALRDFSLPATRQEPCTLQKGRAVSRRWLIAAGGILTVSVALFLLVFLGINDSGGYTQQTVLDEAWDFFEADAQAARGQLLDQSPAPSEFPLSKQIQSFRGIRWRAVKNFLKQEGVAFDLPAQGGARATLYVVDRTVASLPVSPTLRPSNTGGCCVAAWQEDGLVYVLVVQGNRQNYQQYLNLPRGPMA